MTLDMKYTFQVFFININHVAFHNPRHLAQTGHQCVCFPVPVSPHLGGDRRFHNSKNFDGYLFIITRNIIFNYSRRYFIGENTVFAHDRDDVRRNAHRYEVEHDLFGKILGLSSF